MVRDPVPAGYDPGAHPPFAVTVDVVVFTIVAGELSVLLVERAGQPYAGRWALPGGFVQPDEGLDAAARRELVEETGVDAAGHLEQLGAFGDPERDPRMRVVSIAYLAFLRDVGPIAAGSDAARAELVPVSDVLAEPARRELAFDHLAIVRDAVARARARLASTSLATAFVGPEFTLAELRGVFEAAWGRELNPGNFRRKVLSTPGFVEPTGRTRPSPGGPVAETYTAGDPVELRTPFALEPDDEQGVRLRDRIRARRRDAPPAAPAAGLAFPRSERRDAASVPFAASVGSAPRPPSGSPAGDRPVWRIRAWDDPELEAAMLAEGIVAIGGDELGDLSSLPSSDELASRLRAAPALRHRSDIAISRFVTYWQAFLHEMRPGDHVLVPLTRRRVAVGRISGDYRYRADHANPRLRHARPVSWLRTFHRDAMDTDLRRRVDAPGTVARVRLPDANTRVERLLSGS